MEAESRFPAETTLVLSPWNSSVSRLVAATHLHRKFHVLIHLTVSAALSSAIVCHFVQDFAVSVQERDGVKTMYSRPASNIFFCDVLHNLLEPPLLPDRKRQTFKTRLGEVGARMTTVVCTYQHKYPMTVPGRIR